MGNTGRSQFALKAALKTVLARMRPVWQSIERVIGWEGLSFVFVSSIALGLLAMDEFTKAKWAFAVSSIVLAVKLVSSSRKYLVRPAWRLGGTIGGIALSAGFFFGMWYWVLQREAKVNQTLSPNFGQWYAPYIGYFQGLSWRTIGYVGGLFIIVVLFVIRERQYKKRHCRDQTLHQQVESDRAQISYWLKLIGVECVTHFDDTPYIDFVFRLYNLALVSVSIDDAIEGRIKLYKDRKTDGKTLRQATIETNLAKNCLFRGGYHFIIRQEVSPEQATLINSSPDSSFYFGDLKITMHGEGFSGVRFGTSFQVDTKAGYWPGYAYGDAGTQSLIKVKSALPQEADEGNRVALWERNPAHPGGEIFVAGDTPVEAAITLEVVKAIQDGKLTIVE